MCDDSSQSHNMSVFLDKKVRYLVIRVDIVECITMYKDISHIVVCTLHVLSLDIHLKKEIETVAKCS